MSNESTDDEVRRTTDSALARSVIEERGGFPAHEPRSEGQGDQGLIQIGEHGSDDDLKELSWDEFAAEFEEKELVYVYPEDESAAADAGIDPLGRLEKRSAE